ncbi:hypothetical protein CRE_22710 [Caenorhabditis remanei]|uniref:RING-type domain-containing protein n=1 Tax=Caenorhabditis remanei TaxID=31234 RepID=E3NJT0_CAERE|nr:hypothetical protein CRE_22710 [Caenorhabditis remanei]
MSLSKPTVSLSSGRSAEVQAKIAKNRMKALEKRVAFLEKESTELKNLRIKLKIAKSRGNALERRLNLISKDNDILAQDNDTLAQDNDTLEGGIDALQAEVARKDLEIARRDAELAWFNWNEEVREESRICQLCLQEYSHEANIPKVIACGHICCHNCLAQVTEEINGVVVARCWICRRYTKKPQDRDFATAFIVLPRLLPRPPAFVQL